MRHARLKIRNQSAVYHCVSRTVNREMLFHRMAKEVLRKHIWQVAEFSGVEVLTFCVMSNHFHVLIRVPEVGKVKVSNYELIRRYRVLYPEPKRYQIASSAVLFEILEKGGEEAEIIRSALLSRMHDVSQYMKTLKQRFSIYYNRSYGRVGTLWSERFKSTIVETGGWAPRVVAAYIDLNPVRAGLVDDPKDYRWSSYGEASAGATRARAGLMSAVDGGFGQHDWRTVANDYRRLLYCKGASPAPGKEGKAMRIPVATWRREMERGAELPVSSALRCRIRYFTDGAILGSQAYVEEVFQAFREHFSSGRKTGSRKMKGSFWEGLVVSKDLRGEVFG